MMNFIAGEFGSRTISVMPRPFGHADVLPRNILPSSASGIALVGFVLCTITAKSVAYTAVEAAARAASRTIAIQRFRITSILIYRFGDWTELGEAAQIKG